MKTIDQATIVRELCEKKVNDLIASGLPPALIATELVTQASVLMTNCSAEQARPLAAAFWEKVMTGINQAAADRQVLRCSPPSGSA